MIGGCAIKTILIKLIRATFRAAHVTVKCSQFNFRLWPFNRCSFQQTTSEQRLHHSKAYCGRSGHAVPVHEAHQRHLGAGWAKGADGEPKLHGETMSCVIVEQFSEDLNSGFDRTAWVARCCSLCLRCCSVPPLRWHAALKPGCQRLLSAANFRSPPLLCFFAEIRPASWDKT